MRLTRPRILALLVLLGAGLFQSLGHAATGTLMPTPFQVFLDNNGNPISGGKVCTYAAGTTTPAATYTDSALSVPNGNPIVTDLAGRFTAWLPPGAAFKFIYQNNDGTANTCNGTVIKTVDNISAVPGSSSSLDITGTAGETLTAGQAVYLSDGSGAKTAGQWFKADSANSYSSTLPELGMVPSTIIAGSSGTIRMAGSITGLSSLTIGTTYYVGTAGAITASVPTLSRLVGVADTTSSLVLGAPPPVVVVNQGIVQGRLTLTTLVPVTTADVTAATTLRYTPYIGNLIALYNGTVWGLYTFPELSIAVPATTSQMYDVFVFDNAGTRTLELLAWTNDTTRATALVLQDGVLSKTGALTRRYVGSFRTTAVSGQTEDSTVKRFVWNYNNRQERVLLRRETTASWAYSVATARQANNSTANQLAVVVGVAEVPVSVGVSVFASNTNGSAACYVGIGQDSVTAVTTGQLGGEAYPPITGVTPMSASLLVYPPIGFHYYAWLEFATATGTTTWYASNILTQVSGLAGWIWG